MVDFGGQGMEDVRVVLTVQLGCVRWSPRAPGPVRVLSCPLYARCNTLSACLGPFVVCGQSHCVISMLSLRTRVHVHIE